MRPSTLILVALALVLCSFAQNYNTNICLSSFNCLSTTPLGCVSPDRSGFDCQIDLQTVTGTCVIPQCGTDYAPECPAGQACIETPGTYVRTCQAISYVDINQNCTGNSTSIRLCRYPYQCNITNVTDDSGTCIDTGVRGNDESCIFSGVYPPCPVTTLCTGGNCVKEIPAWREDRDEMFAILKGIFPESSTAGDFCNSTVQCRNGLRCDTNASRCVHYSTPQAGCPNSCLIDDECSTKLCINFTCVPGDLKVGQTAIEARQCLSNNITDGKCSGVDCSTLTCGDTQTTCGYNVLTSAYECLYNPLLCDLASGNYYFTENNLCTRSAVNGEDCGNSPLGPCISGYTCVIGKCRPYTTTTVPIGAPCRVFGTGSNVQCVSAAYCPTGLDANCTALPTQNQTCLAFNPRCAPNLYCEPNTVTCMTSTTHKQPCLYAAADVGNGKFSYTDNCTASNGERCMCLGGANSHCYLQSDVEYSDYYQATAKSASALYQSRRHLAYAFSLIDVGSRVANQDLFRKCGAWAALQNFKTQGTFGNTIDRLPEQCRPVFLDYYCSITCGYGAIYTDIWSQASPDDKLRLRTENNYDVTKSREFVIHAGNAYQINCQSTPYSYTVNNAVCDYYVTPPLPDPLEVIRRSCGPLNLQTATYTAQFSFHTDAPVSILNQKLRELGNYANATASGQDVLVYSVNVATTGSNATGTTYQITVTFTGPAAIAENAATSMKYISLSLVGSIPGSTTGEVRVIAPPDGSFAFRSLPSLALVAVLAFLASVF